MTPTHPGYYWAQSGSYQWYNLIAQVSGTAPFFEVTVWDRMSDRLEKLCPADIKAWGPEIIPRDLSLSKFAEETLRVAVECNCRAEHGAHGAEHLRAIEKMLRDLVNRYSPKS